jgi:hypothetical protein
MRLDSEYQTGPGRIAIEQDRTGPADTLLTADMRSCQSKIMTQEVAQ